MGVDGGWDWVGVTSLCEGEQDSPSRTRTDAKSTKIYFVIIGVMLFGGDVYRSK
jgi:hypothetical protein